MTRQEHLAWSKERALEYLPDDPATAAASFLSDLGKHDELQGHSVKELIGMHMFSGLLTPKNCRDLIQGTN